MIWRIWVVIAVIYAAFCYWYTSFGGPLSDEEIEQSLTRVEGVRPGDTSQDVMSRYTEPFLGKALLRAAHPVMFGTAAAPSMDLWGIEGAERWNCCAGKDDRLSPRSLVSARRPTASAGNAAGDIRTPVAGSRGGAQRRLNRNATPVP